MSCQQNNQQTSEIKSSNYLNVAVFGGNGASATCILETMEALKIDVEIQASVIQSYQIQNGELDNFDVKNLITLEKLQSSKFRIL